MEETLIKRIMPNSLEAEQSVVGSMIMDKDAIVLQISARPPVARNGRLQWMMRLYADGR